LFFINERDINEDLRTKVWLDGTGVFATKWLH